MEMKQRNLTIVLIDLVGSTAFVQRVGAMRAAEWLQYHDRLARSLLYRFQGREIDRSDGFLLSFDRPIDALNWALYYQAEIPLRTRLGARIGIHWGTVVEVQQNELDVAVGAKRVELEGIAKNIAARTMSVCGAGQVLLTQAALDRIRGKKNPTTPKGTRFACVGLYRFKGVSEPVALYAVGSKIEVLQPPQGNAKAKRIGGPKRVKSHARHRRFLEWCQWFVIRGAIVSLIYLFVLLYPFLSNRDAREMWGLESLAWFDFVVTAVEAVKEAFSWLINPT